VTPPYRLTRSAAADLRNIVRRTDEEWGAAQRQAYVAQLEDAACALALGQGVFKKLDEVLPGLRMKLAGHHYLFCLPQPLAVRR
jgi:plasmid stabilization system protein ParE